MKIEVIKGDITEVSVDAIVNAANTSLLGGGGVDGAIHRKGGPSILEACYAVRNKQGGCEVGKAVITTAGKLPAMYVIHTVGPVWNDGNNGEDLLLESCYKQSLALAVENGIKSIAFPNISTGIYRYPKDKAAVVAVSAVQAFPEKEKLDLVIFVCYDDENFALYTRLLTPEP